MQQQSIRKLAVSAMLVALTVVLSAFSIPIGASRCFPVQHMVNILSAVLLGPFYGVAIAFCTSLIRNLMGTGTLLAFPGSMVGALCCGLVYHLTQKLLLTSAAEVIGTGVLGGLLAYPLASLLLGREGAVYAYILPFLVSTAGGSLIAVILIRIMQRTGALAYLRHMLAQS